VRTPVLTLLALFASAAPAAAHDAFGDLGPFYQAALHPLADPAQGLFLVAAALLLARQPLGTVRLVYPALIAAGFATIALGAILTLPDPGLRAMALAALALAAAAILNLRPSPAAAIVAAVTFGALAALPLDSGSDGRAAFLGLVGGAVGIAIATLWVWGAGEWADRRISPMATTVAAAWVAAIALMAAVLPA
jgi:urease accessory protein